MGREVGEGEDVGGAKLKTSRGDTVSTGGGSLKRKLEKELSAGTAWKMGFTFASIILTDENRGGIDGGDVETGSGVGRGALLDLDTSKGERLGGR